MFQITSQTVGRIFRYSLIIIVAAIIGVMGIKGIKRLSRTIKHINTGAYAELNEIVTAERHIYKSVLGEKNYLLYGSEDTQKQVMKDLDIINKHLTRVNNFARKLGHSDIAETARKARSVAEEYRNLYNAVAVLSKNQRETMENAGGLAKEMMMAAKTEMTQTGNLLEAAIMSSQKEECLRYRHQFDILSKIHHDAGAACINLLQYVQKRNIEYGEASVKEANNVLAYLEELKLLLNEKKLSENIGKQYGNAQEFLGLLNEYIDASGQLQEHLKMMGEKSDEVVKLTMKAADMGKNIAEELGKKDEELGKELITNGMIVMGIGIVIFVAVGLLIRSKPF